MEQNINYQQDIYIDDNALDVEWLEQPNIAMKYGNHVADCRNKVADLKEQLEIAGAEITNEVNENPEACTNKQKPTKADVEAYCWSKTEYKEIRTKLKEAKAKLEYAEMAYQEIAYTRKKSLEQLVTLHGQQYFAGPKIPRDINKERKVKQEEKQKANAGVANKIQRRKSRTD